MASKYYAVRKGLEIGIVDSWDRCKELTSGYPCAEYKSFKTYIEAQNYLSGGSEQSEESSLQLIERTKQSNEIMVAYVDGSYENVMKAFSYGVYAFWNGTTIEECERLEDPDLVEMRNVAGEIKGAEAAIKLALAKGCKELHIFYDYQGISKWALGEWKTNKEGTKAYKSYFDTIKDKISIHFHKVKGHSGDTYNDEADRLAKSALGL